MNAFLIVTLAIVAAASAQRYVDPRNAAILAEARYLQGDGSFGSAYVQEDGVEFKEETAANGDRKGQYSYVDPNGKKISVQYTAGKNGFQVTGDHLPRAPLPVQAQAPVPQYNPAQQYNAIPQAPQSSYNGVEDGQYRPEIHEHPYAYNPNNEYASSSAPVAPAQSTYSHGFNYQAPQQPQQQYFQQTTTTTPAPHRFFPAGQLDLNRSPDGFSYRFSSNGRQ